MIAGEGGTSTFKKRFRLDAYYPERPFKFNGKIEKLIENELKHFI